MNAVSAVADWLRSPHAGEDRGQDLRPGGPFGETGIAPWDIYSIGAATAKLVGTYFGKERIVGTAESASALADRILADTIGKGQSKEVFFFCGDLRRDELPEKLRQASIKVNELTVYETLPVHRLVDIDYDGIVFFSPSAVHSFFATNTVRAATVIFAIGQTTAETIRGYSPNELVISKTADKESLIRQVIDHY
jgi:uroporphyrinogen-III synthase